LSGEPAFLVDFRNIGTDADPELLPEIAEEGIPHAGFFDYDVIGRNAAILGNESSSTVFWAWSDRVVNQALLGERLWTTFGWQLHVEADLNTRSLCNFPMQANGAEMFRLACIRLVEDGRRICAPSS
jgi:hypothetical protein